MRRNAAVIEALLGDPTATPDIGAIGGLGSAGRLAAGGRGQTGGLEKITFCLCKAAAILNFKLSRA